jgi:tetratricopeptide (TPR) repeat protein
LSFIKTLFGRDWRRFKKKGDAFIVGEEWGRARGALLEATRLFDGDEREKSEIEDQLAMANSALLKMHTEAAERFVKQEMPAKAIEHYTTALDFVGKSHQEHEELQKQIIALQRSMVEPGEVEALIGPESEEQDGAPEEIPFDDEETFNALLNTLNENQADVYLTLGEDFRRAYLALMEGDLDTAEKWLSGVHQEHPDNPYIQYEMGRLRMGQERYEEAEELLRSASEKAPDMIPVRHVRVETLWGLEKYDLAERVVEEAFEIDDELLDNFVIAGETCLRSGEYANGVEIIEAGVELHDKSVILHRLLGKLQMALENVTSAIEAFETALTLRWQYNYDTGKLSFDVESAFLAANLYLSSGTNLPRGEELFKSLLSTGDDPNKIAYLIGLGQTLSLQGEKGDAKNVLLDAATMAPDGSDLLERIQGLIVEL